MKNWSLRVRLTLWFVAFFAGAALLLGAFSLSLVRRYQTDSLDAELASETRTVFHEISEHGPAGVAHALSEVDKDTRPVVTGADGVVIWAAPELAGEHFTGAHRGVQTIGSWRVVSTIQNGYTVRMARGLAEVDAVVADVRRAYLLALPGLLLLVGGGAWVVVQKALRPVQEISETAARITTDHLSERLPLPLRSDELGRLTDVLNQMLDRLDQGFRHAVRFTADASHELKTPLALMATGIDQLLRREDLPPDVIAELGSLLDDNRRLASICQDLLLLARADAGSLVLDRQPHDLCDLIEAAVEDARILAGESGIAFEIDLPARADEVVDDRYFTQVLLNLLSNAVKYNHPRGTIRVRLAAEENRWVLRIANTGRGISVENQAKLFERFFRADNSAESPGHGLGLSLSRELIRAHGGTLVFAGSDGDWTTFTLDLPRSPAAPQISPVRAPALAQPVSVGVSALG